jgi:hypothetical protein
MCKEKQSYSQQWLLRLMRAITVSTLSSLLGITTPTGSIDINRVEKPSRVPLKQ